MKIGKNIEFKLNKNEDVFTKVLLLLIICLLTKDTDNQTLYYASKIILVIYCIIGLATSVKITRNRSFNNR